MISDLFLLLQCPRLTFENLNFVIDNYNNDIYTMKHLLLLFSVADSALHGAWTENIGLK